MLNYKVSILVEKMAKHYTYAPFDNSYISDKLAAWMMENIKHEWNWDSGRAPDAYYYVIFRFKNEEDAIAFKLRWM